MADQFDLVVIGGGPGGYASAFYAASTSESKSNFVATLLGGQTFESQKVLENQPLALWFWAPG